VKITILMGIAISPLISLCMRDILTMLIFSMHDHKMSFQILCLPQFLSSRFIIFIVKIFLPLGLNLFLHIFFSTINSTSFLDFCFRSYTYYYVCMCVIDR
jgi:hypothetical protein